MPTRNIVKTYGENQYYHVYNCGVAQTSIFRTNTDYQYMLSLLERYLTPGQKFDKLGRVVPNYSDKIELVSFCLMPNHYHFLFYLKEKDGLEKLMRSLMTSYSMYFNKKHKRSGTLFQNHFLATLIRNDQYLWHISRYIHLNPMDIRKDWQDYKYSSAQDFLDTLKHSWVHSEYILETENDRREYYEFATDYETAHQDIVLLKRLLANEMHL